MGMVMGFGLMAGVQVGGGSSSISTSDCVARMPARAAHFFLAVAQVVGFLIGKMFQIHLVQGLSGRLNRGFPGFSLAPGAKDGKQTIHIFHHIAAASAAVVVQVCTRHFLKNKFFCFDPDNGTRYTAAARFA
jgi:hypothetical protein